MKKQFINVIYIIVVATILFLMGCGKTIKAISTTGEVPEEKSFWEIHKVEELVGNDFLLYLADCGNKEGAFETGLYQSVADQPFGEDPKTGKNWGYADNSYLTATADKMGAEITSYKWEIAEGTEYDAETTGFYYDFEVPTGEYEVVLGFYNPFNVKKIDVSVEGEVLLEQEKALKYELTEKIVYTTVTDGMLNVKVYNSKRGKDAMKNPILSYIKIKAVPEYSREMLLAYIESLKTVSENKDKYIEDSYLVFIDKYKEAEQTLIKWQDSVNTEYRKAYFSLKEAYEGLEEIMVYSSFVPGEPWTDTKGTLIQAHGGQVQKLTYTDKKTGKEVSRWWWVGEDKTNGYRGGICAYSSDDLYNWQFEGIVMRNVTSREQLNTDEYFTKLYADYSEEQLDNVYMCINSTTSVIERPKMIYNEKTGKYVMWFHADGPTATSNSNYAAASAGLAIADTPYGPFKFIDRYRLNTCPEGEKDYHPESKGMARDMNLFVDDDGTAYIIYSSEENLTLYISRLNDEYTYLATKPEEAVYGVDFIRLFPGAQREAPAIIKKDGVYYLMTSGCSGWAPNQARYYVSDAVLGEWENKGDPCVGDANKTTFDSQSTCIFKASDNTYIYMGDRWNSDDLCNSRYIWLPINFGSNNTMSLEYIKEWTLK